MSNKPSLYVVEKKEVVILVILFVLITVLAFTLGVKYGEGIGRKAYLEDQATNKQMGEELAGSGGEGTLGEKNSDVTHSAEAVKASSDHGGEHSEGATVLGEEISEDSPERAALSGGHASKDSSGGQPQEVDSKQKTQTAEKTDGPSADEKGLRNRPKEPVDTGSDEHLLGALKEAGIQAAKPIGKSPDAAKALPSSIKTPRSGAFTVQVGSYPSRSDAEQQLRRLKEKRLDAMMLDPVSERNGEWFRVTIGSFSSKSEAEKYAKQLQEKGQIKSYFVRKAN